MLPSTSGSISMLMGLGGFSANRNGGLRGSWSKRACKQNALCNKNRMCTPQINSTAGWTASEDGETSQASKRTQFFNITLGSWSGGGNRTFLFFTQPQGAHMPKNPKLWICVQTRSTFNALILNEGCYAGQIPQACLGPKEAKMCIWRPDKFTAPSKLRKKKQRGSGRNEQQDLFPSIFPGLGTTVNTEHESQQ